MSLSLYQASVPVFVRMLGDIVCASTFPEAELVPDPNGLALTIAKAAALAHGGTCDGPPGPRPQYHAHYYGAYFKDPDGNKLSAVCDRAE